MNRVIILLRAVGAFGLEAISVTALVLLAGATLMPAIAQGQILVANETGNTIGEYNLDGTTVKAPVVSGLNAPIPIAVSGADLFVSNDTTGTISEYILGATPGTITSSFPSLITGLPINTIGGLAVSGSDLFVTSTNGIGEYTLGATPGTIASSNPSLISLQVNELGLAASGSDIFATNGSAIFEYTTSGTAVNPSPLISGLNDAGGLSVSGTDIFVVNEVSDPNNHNGTIGEYSTSGLPLNASLLTGLNSPSGTAVFGSELFVADLDDGTIDEYTLGATPGTITSSILPLVSGLDAPVGIVVVPEPSAGALLCIGGVAVLALRSRRSKA
jgi:hypothetical protein